MEYLYPRVVNRHNRDHVHAMSALVRLDRVPSHSAVSK